MNMHQPYSLGKHEAKFSTFRNVTLIETFVIIVPQCTLLTVYNATKWAGPLDETANI